MKFAFFLYWALLCAALLAAMPFATLSAAARTAATPVFERLDRNNDGVIDAREAQAVRGLAQSLDKLDANRDGKLDRVEFARW